MVRLVVTIMLWLLAFCADALAKPQPFIEITLETPEAFLGDTITIEVRWSGLLDPIDFSVLEVDAELVRQTAGTRIAVVDGQVIEIASRRIELQPLKIGRLTLGPLEGDGVTSNSVSIDVTEPRTIAWTPGEEDVRLSQTISNASPWLQQQAVLDIEFRTRHPLIDEAAILPKLDDFRVVPIFEKRRTLDETNGWALIAWRYLLFPQHSGKQVIAGAKIAGTLAKSRAERGVFELVATPLNLNVRQSAFPASTWWVAASGLAIKDEWSADPTKLAAGDETDRTITVSASGILPEQIPQIEMNETQGLSITPLGVDRKSMLVNDVVQATAAFRFRVRALSPIPVFLDTVRLRWWNTTDNKSAEAIIPARRIDIGKPDRDALLEGALRDETWLDRLMVQGTGYSGIAYPALILAGLALALLLGRALPASVGRWLEARRARNALFAAARNGDASALYRTMHQLAHRDASARAALAPSITKLGAEIFGPSPSSTDLVELARQAAQHLNSRTTKHPASSLPEL